MRRYDLGVRTESGHGSYCIAVLVAGLLTLYIATIFTMIKTLISLSSYLTTSRHAHQVDSLERYPDHPIRVEQESYVSQDRFVRDVSARRTSWSSRSGTMTAVHRTTELHQPPPSSPNYHLARPHIPTHALHLLLDIIHPLALQHPSKSEESTQNDGSGDELIHRRTGHGGRCFPT